MARPHRTAIGSSSSPRRHPGRQGAPRPGVRPEGPLRGTYLLVLAALFVGVALWQVAPALHGEFLSDDQSYIVQNAYVHELNWQNLRGILDPWGEPAAYTANYAPVHLLLHALEYRVFGPQNLVGWHAVNAVAHALASLALVAFFLRSGLSLPASVLGGSLFLVHPANVETVAWIFQLKTLVSVGLALAALVLLQRRPVGATLLFTLALLTKISALFALPVAAVQIWIQSRSTGEKPGWGTLAAWAGLALVVGALELQAYQVQGDSGALAYTDATTHARTVVAIAARYLAMAATSWGVSTFHQPPPATSWMDPWWLAGAFALGLLGWRTLATLRRGEPEAIFWILAAAGFAPVSQIFPFVYPMGDRYLYPILPGLIGGTFFALRSGLETLARRRAAPSEGLHAVALALCLALVVVFAVQSRARAPVFQNGMTMMLDAAIHYPDGLEAHLLRGFRAAREGDAREAARSYRRAVERGYTDLLTLLTAPYLDTVRGHPEFQAVLREVADRTVLRIRSREDPSQMELVLLARAHEVRGERKRAIQAYERGLDRQGPLRDSIRRALARLRRPSSLSDPS